MLILASFVALRAQAATSVKEMQEQATLNGLYFGPKDGKINLDTVVAGVKMCRLDKSYCELSDSISKNFYIDRANILRYALVFKKEIFSELRSVIGNTPVLNAITSDPAPYLSSLMRGSLVSNILFDKQNEYIVYNNPTISVVTIFKIENGAPTYIKLLTTENLLSQPASVLPNWLVANGHNLKLISNNVKNVRELFSSQDVTINRIFESTLSESEISILMERVVHTVDNVTPDAFKCGNILDNMAKVKGGLLKEYNNFIEKSLSNPYLRESSFVPSNGFAVKDASYIRLYSDFVNPEYMAIVHIKNDGCVIKSINFPLLFM